MFEMTQKVVLRCNSLVYNQISNQNLTISNIWTVNWHFMSKFCPKMTENPKKYVIFFRRKFELVLQFLSDSAKIWYIVSLRVIKNSLRGIFFFCIFCRFMARQKWKMAILGDFGDFLRAQVRVKSEKMKISKIPA